MHSPESYHKIRAALRPDDAVGADQPLIRCRVELQQIAVLHARQVLHIRERNGRVYGIAFVPVHPSEAGLAEHARAVEAVGPRLAGLEALADSRLIRQ